MKDKRPYFRSLVWVILISTYITLQFFWWGYLLTELYKKTSPDSTSKTYMVLGEALVFFVFLAFGIYKLFKSIADAEKLNLQKKNFLLATSHELRTPIAGIKLGLETLESKIERLTPEQINSLLKKSIKETDRLELLINNMLLINKAEFETLDFYPVDINLSSFFNSEIERLKNLVPENTISIIVSENIHITCDEYHLKSILDNLIENASKYAGSSSEIKIEAIQKSDATSIIIKDEGKGIPKPDWNNIFKAFYRIQNEEVRSQKGTGLGLYIVKKLVELNKASIRYIYNTEGSQFEIKWKKQTK
jgi:two-component system, OmpR family, phosphate regulon sensor histidine kinase PhoR